MVKFNILDILILNTIESSTEYVNNLKMKFIMIHGTTGTGKSHFLSYIGQELLGLSKHDFGNGKIGFELFSGRGQHRLSSSPFQIWKSIIKSMLKRPTRALSNLETIRKLRSSSGNCSSPRQQPDSPRANLGTPSKYYIYEDIKRLLIKESII